MAVLFFLDNNNFWLAFLSLGFCALFLLTIVGVGILYVFAPQQTPRTENEWFYVDPSSGEKKRFPSLVSDQTADVDLSLIVPAYNEEERLPIMLQETIGYLTERQKKDKSFTYEIIIVDDGSRDGTYQVGLDASKKYGCEKVRVLKEDKNRGKGGAVRLGMEVARGRRLLMVDADAATKISDVERLEESLNNKVKNGYGVAVGSRAHMQDEAVAKRSFFRNILMHGFHFLVLTLGGVRGVRDTQCGFKLFTRASARVLFPNLHLERWCFDVELLYTAQTLEMPIAEVPVNWHEVAGSKLDPMSASIEMLKDLILIRTFFITGIWKAVPENIAQSKKRQ
eukprot:comp16793_c0_seq1/m.15182 comp16793_c0_seq1/g.15182  ORF comp16793_c0_seq1/g.15182 comp16793_c0_seq1/m.15182 type:complete len:338 (-) comp16793_c0_seq1:29-1042(-)